MATDPNDKGQPLNVSEAAMKREAEAMEVEGKLAWLIDTATPEEPRYTPPSEEERESGRVLSEVEADILSSASSTQGPRERTLFDVVKWMVIPGLLVLVVLFIAVLGFAISRRDGQSQAPAPAAQPGTSDGRVWYFTNMEGLGLYTIALQGDGTAGPTDVIEDTTDTGTYSWVDDTLTIDFTREITMTDGYVITEPWGFVCAGTPDSAQMTCDVTRPAWRYSIDGGVEVLEDDLWPALAVPR